MSDEFRKDQKETSASEKETMLHDHDNIDESETQVKSKSDFVFDLKDINEYDDKKKENTGKTGNWKESIR